MHEPLLSCLIKELVPFIRHSAACKLARLATSQPRFMLEIVRNAAEGHLKYPKIKMGLEALLMERCQRALTYVFMSSLLMNELSQRSAKMLWRSTLSDSGGPLTVPSM